MKKAIYTIGVLMFLTVTLKPMMVFGSGDQYSGKEEDVPYTEEDEELEEIKDYKYNHATGLFE